MNARLAGTARSAASASVATALLVAGYDRTPSADPFLDRDPDFGRPVYSGAYAITGAIAMIGQDGNAE